MAWLNREKAPLFKGEKIETPSGLWMKCKECNEIIFTKEFEKNLYVCTSCGYHYPVPAHVRVEQLLDEGSFEELDAGLKSADPLSFNDSKPYKKRLKDMESKNAMKDALLSGKGKIEGIDVYLGVFQFGFIGGSMGVVVGERIKRLFTRAAENQCPVIIVSSSGGARMQEGILSLMQMAKTCCALALAREKGAPFISVLTNPTTGGVAASYAMLGDVNIGEPGAIIGFAGPRVIEQTIRQKLPEGFQRSEYLLEHGMLDILCHREVLRGKIHQVIALLKN